MKRSHFGVGFRKKSLELLTCCFPAESLNIRDFELCLSVKFHRPLFLPPRRSSNPELALKYMSTSYLRTNITETFGRLAPLATFISFAFLFAPMESVFGTLKTELVHQREYPDRDAARRDLVASIEAYYNRRPIHSAIGYITPEQAYRKSA